MESTMRACTDAKHRHPREAGPCPGSPPITGDERSCGGRTSIEEVSVNLFRRLFRRLTRGFTSEADKVLEGNSLTKAELDFLQIEFPAARERMTGFATTATTVGSLVLVLVALLVGFAKGSQDQSDKVVQASQKYDLLLSNCTDTSTDETCNQAVRQQALQNVVDAQNRVGDLDRLNE